MRAVAMDSASTSEPARRSDTSTTVHSYNVRICHWVNVVACAYLLWSGIHILLDFPELYWGNTGYRGYPAVFRLADWGLSWDDAGALGDRRWGRNYHFTFAWVFLINGLAYIGWNLYSTHFRARMLPARDELTVAHLRTEVRDHFRWRSRPAQPEWHLRGAAKDLVRNSDLRIRAAHLSVHRHGRESPGFTAAMPWLLDLFGGRQTARTLHTIGTAMLVLFVVVHVLEVVAAGFVSRVRSMITGR